MKHRYRATLMSLFILSAFGLSAQSLQIGLKVGLNASSLQLQDPSIPNNRTKLGLNLGATATYYLRSNLFLQSGLSLTSKGMHLTDNSSLGFGDQLLLPGREASLISRQWYLQAPLYLGYAIPLRPTTKLIFNAGPYLAYGLFGKTQLTGDIIYGDMIEYSTWKEPTFGERGLQRVDVGLGMGVGLEVGRATIGITYELGLRDISPTQAAYIPFYAGSYKNRLVSLSIQHRL